MHGWREAAHPSQRPSQRSESAARALGASPRRIRAAQSASSEALGTAGVLPSHAYPCSLYAYLTTRISYRSHMLLLAYLSARITYHTHILIHAYLTARVFTARISYSTHILQRAYLTTRIHVYPTRDFAGALRLVSPAGRRRTLVAHCGRRACGGDCISYTSFRPCVGECLSVWAHQCLALRLERGQG